MRREEGRRLTNVADHSVTQSPSEMRPALGSTQSCSGCGSSPAWYRPQRAAPCWAAGALTVLILVFSRPLVAGWGRRPGNSPTLPHDYGRYVVALLVGVWAVSGVVIAVRARRLRRLRRS